MACMVLGKASWDFFWSRGGLRLLLVVDVLIFRACLLVVTGFFYYNVGGYLYKIRRLRNSVLIKSIINLVLG